jgi:hypothetical protein
MPTELSRPLENSRPCQETLELGEARRASCSVRQSETSATSQRSVVLKSATWWHRTQLVVQGICIAACFTRTASSEKRLTERNVASRVRSTCLYMAVCPDLMLGQRSGRGLLWDNVTEFAWKDWGKAGTADLSADARNPNLLPETHDNCYNSVDW